MKQSAILIGGGGHARVLFEIMKYNQLELIAVCSPDDVVSTFQGIPHLKSDHDVLGYDPDQVILINGIGSTGHPTRRMEAFTWFKSRGFSFATLIHPAAIISPEVELAEGVQVMAGAVVQPGTKIGGNSLVNTKSSVDHDCRIGAHVHIAPNATLCGNVQIGDIVHIGAGATIVQAIQIGKNSVIGAASLVLHNIGENTTAYGIPAKVASK